MQEDNLYQRLFISMRYFLIGMSYHDKSYLIALDALEYAKGIHIGMRKDGKTPEFQHQLEIAHFLRSHLRTLMYPAETLAAAFLHDVPEDYSISFKEIRERFGKRVARAVKLLTKKYRGKKKDPHILFAKMAKNPIASVVKGADRINNHQSMHPVFTLNKQSDYTSETDEFIVPMLKTARHLHLEQEGVYENIKYVLKSQMQLIRQKIEIAQIQAGAFETSLQQN